MPEPDLLELFVAPLEATGTSYLITGSIAATFYGEPRATHDIDLVVTLSADQITALASAFPSDSFYVPPPEVIQEEARRESRGHFNVIHHASGLKADFYLTSRDELHAWAFDHVRSYSIDGLQIRLAPPEYVITRKLEFYREGHSEKHLRDIRSMLQLSADLIDQPALDGWIRRCGLEEEWAEL
jgi:hypothetical protein